jgi:hypothetical protein
MSKTILSLRSPHALSIVLALALPACALPADDAAGAEDTPTTSEATSALGVIGTTGHWSTPSSSIMRTWQGAQVGTINGRSFTIQAGSCGDLFDCTSDYDRTGIYTAEYVSGNLGSSFHLSNQKSHDKVSVAAFNGFLYMVHMGGSDDDQNTTWMTRFNPANNTWTPDRKITYPTNFAVPTIAAFNNKLYFIGTSNTLPYSMWYGTMDTNENFSSMNAIPGHETSGRINATVAFGKLFFAHRWGQTTDLVYGTFDGSAWSPVNHIYGGTNNSPLQGFEAALAFDGSRLHLVHTRVNDPFVWWTQFDNCNWSTAESQIGGIQSDLAPSLAAGGPGLLMVTDHDDEGDWFDVGFATYTPPTIVTRCGIAHL